MTSLMTTQEDVAAGGKKDLLFWNKRFPVSVLGWGWKRTDIKKSSSSLLDMISLRPNVQKNPQEPGVIINKSKHDYVGAGGSGGRFLTWRGVLSLVYAYVYVIHSFLGNVVFYIIYVNYMLLIIYLWGLGIICACALYIWICIEVSNQPIPCCVMHWLQFLRRGHAYQWISTHINIHTHTHSI